MPNLVWFNYRRIPAVAFAKRLIDEGRLGQTFHYRATYLNQSGNDPSKAGSWRYKRSEAGLGAAGDLLSHSIDSALYLNGPITELTAMTHTFVPGRDVDDATFFLARYANGSVGTFEATRYGVGCRNRHAFEINGSKGMLRFNLEQMNQLEIFRCGRNAQPAGHAEHYGNRPRPSLCREFLEAWTHHRLRAYVSSPHWEISLSRWCGKSRVIPDFDDAVSVQRVLDAVERSASSRGWVKL